MLAVFAAGAFAARWMLGEKHARELAEVRLAGLSAQLSFAGHATEQAAKTIETIRRENETTQKTSTAAAGRRAALHDHFGGLRIGAANGVRANALSTIAGAALDTDDAASQCQSCPVEFEARCAQDALTVMEWQSWYMGIKNDRLNSAESDDLGAGGG